MSKDVKQAVEILNQGGIVIFPTDTAFGIGCRIDSHKSLEKLFNVRRRSKTQAMPVLVGSLNMAKQYAQITDKVVEKLINPFWPGALTIVLQSKNDTIDKMIMGGGDTVGIRMPAHKQLLEVINAVGVPITGSSANFHGEETPFSINDLNKELIQKVDFVLKGECKNNKASTVIDATQNPWKILRQGAINIKIN